MTDNDQNDNAAWSHGRDTQFEAIPDDVKNRALEMLALRMPKVQIAEKLGINRGTLYHWLKSKEFANRLIEINGDMRDRAIQRHADIADGVFMAIKTGITCEYEPIAAAKLALQYAKETGMLDAVADGVGMSVQRESNGGGGVTINIVPQSAPKSVDVDPASVSIEIGDNE